MKEPVDHILRPSLPWRSDPPITECGYDGLKVKALTREEFFERLNDLGQRRAAMLTCMTCSDTAQRHGTWEDDPRLALEREIAWECRHRQNDRGARLRDELLAIAALIETHREEFLATIATNEQRREWLEKKAAHKPKPIIVSRPFGIL